MIKIIQKTLVFALMFVPILVQAESAMPDAELVWFESQQKQQHIRFASFQNEEWLLQELPIYTTKNLISGPTITTRKNGDKLLFWSEVNKSGTVLMMLKGKKGEQQVVWGKPVILQDSYQENLGASAVVDLEDNVWLVWSASGLKPSDVKLKKLTNKGWSATENVHKPNNTPDVLPVTSLNAKGEVVIEWQQFDKTQFSHINKVKTFSPGESNSQAIQELVDALNAEKNIKEIALPSFISQEQLLVVHFPQNRLKKNQVLTR